MCGLISWIFAGIKNLVPFLSRSNIFAIEIIQMLNGIHLFTTLTNPYCTEAFNNDMTGSGLVKIIMQKSCLLV